MSIQVGDTLPSDILLYKMAESGPISETTQSLFQNQRVVLFAVPGAFTPTCSQAHLPGFVVAADKFKQLGVDRIICLSVNDAFVMNAWGKQQNADAIDMLADGNADFVKALGLDMDASGRGMGIRSRRFALIADNGIVRWLGIEEPGQFEKSSADSAMEALQHL
ncbi:peroxiredoxin [Saccharospirillum mangrovi]|uniref:peroxiredoxin n=1 Tax=Saccharospirillum mangrovi TaxID=2161747 RepID=UPI000D33FCD7|nr:peroxiredoxin [Saccharospirillum mangrovi]